MAGSRATVQSPAAYARTKFIGGFSSVFVDASLYHTGTIGNNTDDLAAVSAAITALKLAGRGVLYIPPNFNATFDVPALNLSANQSLAVIDNRIDKLATFGGLVFYIEARDAGGGYASELRLKGKQNPGLVLQPLSDGSAPGYTLPNNMTTVVSLDNAGVGNIQYLTDPFAKGYAGDFVWYNLADNRIMVYYGSDAGGATRIDVSPISFDNVTLDILGASNTSPIVIQTDGNHHIEASTRVPIGISGCGGNTAANGSWLCNVLTADTLELIGSTGNGAYTSGGEAFIQPNAQRAVLNLPASATGDSALAEGRIISTVAQGTAPLNVLSQTGDSDLHACPLIYNINGVQQSGATPGLGRAKLVMGTVSLVAGSAVVTLANNAIFTSTSTYKVFPIDQTDHNNGVRATKSSGSQFTLTGVGTDSIDWFALGF